MEIIINKNSDTITLEHDGIVLEKAENIRPIHTIGEIFRRVLEEADNVDRGGKNVPFDIKLTIIDDDSSKTEEY